MMRPIVGEEARKTPVKRHPDKHPASRTWGTQRSSTTKTDTPFVRNGGLLRADCMSLTHHGSKPFVQVCETTVQSNLRESSFRK